MKKSILISTLLIIGLVSLLLILKPSFTGYSIYPQGEYDEKIKLGYCPTMGEEAFSLSEKYSYELVQLGSSVEVLFALKNRQIDKALIGRKAELTEINYDTKEIILKSGYTLVSKEKRFVDYSKLPSVEIYTYLPNETALSLIPENSRIIYNDKNELLKKINDKKIALISWDDWNDGFELIVVMNKNKKIKDFRGVFLYEN